MSFAPPPPRRRRPHSRGALSLPQARIPPAASQWAFHGRRHLPTSLSLLLLLLCVFVLLRCCCWCAGRPPPRRTGLLEEVTAAPSESQRWAKPAAAEFDGHLVLGPARGGRNRRMRDLVACLRGLIGDAELRPPPPPPPAEAMAILGTGRVDLVVQPPPWRDDMSG
jgi:hypothetical protein